VQKVNSVRNDLPEEIADLIMMKWSITSVKILQLALVSDSSSYKIMEKEAERLEDELKKVSGVKDTEILAYPEQEIRISLDFEKAAAMNISLNTVMNVIKSANTNIPGGSIEVGNKNFNIQTSGSYETIKDIKNTVVSSADGKVVYLKDIAEINFSYEDNMYYARVAGKRTLFITATQKLGTNIFDVMDGLKAKINDYKDKLPENIELEIVVDQSQSVSNRLNGFFMNLLQGLILVGLVILIAVNIRASVIVMLAIPISIFIGIGILDLSGYGLEQMSIAGLVIALGLLVDNAIVVTENISRFMKLGYSGYEAAVKGTGQIGWAIISSTATTVLAFVPIIMIQNITGEFIRSLPLTVVYTLGASLMVSLLLTPFLSSKFIKINGGYRESRARKSLNRFIETYYRKILQVVLANPKKTLAYATVFFLSSLVLFPAVGVSFFPKADKAQLLINIEAPEGTNISRVDEISHEIETHLLKMKEVKTYAANIGRGNPRIYYNLITQNDKQNYGQILVVLHEKEKEHLSAIVKKLREKYLDYIGAVIEVKEFKQGPPVEAPIAIRVVGEDLKSLKKISGYVEKVFRKVPGTVNVYNPLGSSKTDLHLNINRDKAAMFGVPLVEIDKTV
ncbi:MAG: efflux RND transporter permease subunit, partial [Calditrichia bacterium]|nr:efflux RND transporter permease subunit [Calditrichia bacterium]